MLNLIDKKIASDKIKNNTLKLSDIEKLYKKEHKNFLYGLEYERLSLDKNTLENASYLKLAKIIKHFSQISNWELVYDNKTIIGAYDKNSNSISSTKLS